MPIWRPCKGLLRRGGPRDSVIRFLRLYEREFLYLTRKAISLYLDIRKFRYYIYYKPYAKEESMGIVQAIKKGFVTVNKLMPVVGIFFVFNALVSLISLPLTDPARAGQPGTMVVSVVSSIIFFLVFIFLQGGALGMVKNSIKTGGSSLANFMDYGKKFYVRILGLLLVYIILAILIVFVLGLISAGLLLIGDNTFTRALVAVIVTAASLALITFLIYPIYALVADDIGPIDALKRGFTASKENFWKTLGLFLLLLIISLVISFIIGALIGIVTVPVGPGVSQVVVAVVNAAVQSYIPLVMMVAFMSMYLALSSSGLEETPGEMPPGEGMQV